MTARWTIMTLTLTTMLALSILQMSARAATEDNAKKAVPEVEMRTYVVGFLNKGPKWTAEATEETRKIHEGHMANIKTMAAAGKLILAGPFSDDGKLRGMFVFDLTSLEEAKALVEKDPAVKAGRLVVELHSWYSAKGITIVPAQTEAK